MKTTLTVFMLSIGLLAPNFAYAEKPTPQPKREESISSEKMVLARQLVQVLEYQQDWEKQIEKSFEKAKQFEKNNPDNKNNLNHASKDTKDFDETINTIKAVDISEPMAIEYAQVYTLDELKQLLHFYNTQAGKQIYKKQKILQTRYSQIALETLQHRVKALHFAK